tara:strand:+ start:1264 stop:1836 length:573 start_codon:yes stop_codon:yes gene_type:complete
MKKYILDTFAEALETYKLISNNKKIIDTLEAVTELSAKALLNGNKLIFAGNGGSAADAQHISAELIGRFEKKRSSLAAISLATNISTLTAISNDYGFDDIFSRQISSIALKGDIFFAISTSGNSQNILNSVEVAKKRKITTIGLTGLNKGKINNICDYVIEIPSKKTSRIQEGHILIGHTLCGLIEKKLF